MLKVGRNDTCPCGSGKKYKKCCEKKEVVSITSIVDQEIIDIQNEIVGFAHYHFGGELEQVVTEKYSEFEVPEDDEDMSQILTLLGWAWTIFNEPIKTKGNKRIIDLYLAENGNRISRTRTREIVRSWTNGKSTISRLLEKDSHEILVQDLFTKETKKVKLLTKDLFKEFEIGSFLLGTLVPLGESYMYFLECVGIEGTKSNESLILRIYEDTHLDDPAEFLKEDFLFIVGISLLDEDGNTDLHVDVDNVEWATPLHQLIAKFFQSKMVDQPEQFTSIGLLIWKVYTDRKAPLIKNPNIAVAALHYLLDQLFTGIHTQKSIAEVYGVSAGSVSTRYRDIYDTTEDIIKEIYHDVIIPETDSAIGRIIEINERMIAKNKAKIAEYAAKIEEAKLQESNKQPSKKKPKKPSQRDKSKAQDLIYQAINANGKERVKLAKKGIELDPYHADGYTILAEEARTIDETMNLLKRGMEMGAQELGEHFFKENTGHFWGLIETRPYMRAKSNYAFALKKVGKTQDAIKHYEELLKLNPMDNQGVRYELIEAYLEMKSIEKAKDLLEQFPEDSTDNLYNLALIEYLEQGNTVTLKKRLKEAKKQNPFVGDYLLGKKKLPTTLPEYYGWGDENEAIVYAAKFIDRWVEQPLLLKMF